MKRQWPLTYSSITFSSVYLHKTYSTITILVFEGDGVHKQYKGTIQEIKCVCVSMRTTVKCKH